MGSCSNCEMVGPKWKRLDDMWVVIGGQEDAATVDKECVCNLPENPAYKALSG
jgi:hypothetical protein